MVKPDRLYLNLVVEPQKAILSLYDCPRLRTIGGSYTAKSGIKQPSKSLIKLGQQNKVKPQSEINQLGSKSMEPNFQIDLQMWNVRN